MVIMDFCTIIQYPVTVFFQAKKIQVAVCLVVWWFSGFGLFQVFFYRSIGPMAPFFGNPGNQMHSTSKNTVFAETARVCTGHGTLDIQALQYLLRWVGVLGCMSFLGPNTEPQELFGCLGFWTEFCLRKDLPKQRWTLKGILDPHCWKLLSFGQNLPVKGFRVKMCKGL